MGKITTHGKYRLKERINNNQRNASYLKVVIRKGKNSFFYNEPFKSYLLSKENKRSVVKVYNDNVFIFTKTGKRLITTYPVPEKYLPADQYEIKTRKAILLEKTKYLYGKPVLVIKRNNEELKGYITDIKYSEKDKYINLVDENNCNVKVFFKSINDIQLIE